MSGEVPADRAVAAFPFSVAAVLIANLFYSSILLTALQKPYKREPKKSKYPPISYIVF